MEEDLGKDEIVLKEKKPRSEAQVKAFEKAREIRLENAKIKKEKIAQVKEEVKNRTRGQSATQPLDKVGEPIVNTVAPSLPKEEPKKNNKKSAVPLEESEDEVVIVKKKKKPKVIYIEESDDEPPQIIKKKKEQESPILVKPPQTIRFC